MIRITRFWILFGLAFVAFLSLAEAQQVPDNFKIIAKYYAGYSVWKQWETAITSDGRVVQDIHPGRKGGEDSTSKTMLTQEDLKELVAMIQASDFDSLKEEYRSRATDQPTLILEITQGRKTHKVLVYGPTLLKSEGKGKEIERFLAVWADVLRKVPSPNPDQTPELYSSKK